MKFKILIIVFLLVNISVAQNVIVVVVDGARYTETFGGTNPSSIIPHLWNDLKPQGTIYENFKNTGLTSTNPGHATLLTGTWQSIANDGTERPTKPTVFEYFRKEKAALETENYVVTGKTKLDILTYCTDSLYGSTFMAAENVANITDNEVYENLITIMNTHQPKLIIVNFPSVDKDGHSGIWDDYINAITNVDSLINQLWIKIQNDVNYRNKTTVFITNDHGRHDYDFKSHGDNCVGCQHIMLLALGRKIPAGVSISETKYQRDIASTIGDLLEFDTPETTGSSLPLEFEIDITVYLEGAYNNNNMFTSLNTQIPKVQSYSVFPWNFAGTEEVISIPPDIVDWVLVELRTDKDTPSPIRRAAFLQNTGKIVNINGTSPLLFFAPSNNYYIVVQHRNHIPIISSNTINLK